MHLRYRIGTKSSKVLTHRGFYCLRLHQFEKAAELLAVADATTSINSCVIAPTLCTQPLHARTQPKCQHR